MTRLERLEKHGYKIVHYMSGKGCEAQKGNFKIKAESVTELHRKVFGY